MIRLDITNDVDRWESQVTAEGFEKLLSSLASDRDAAGEQYEVMRLKLLKYFDWRLCPDPATLADETFDRVARRLDEGEHIRSSEFAVYIYGVARNVLLESWKSRQRQQKAVADRPFFAPPELVEEESRQAEWQSDCLQKCLALLPERTRSLLIRYHGQTGGKPGPSRLELADELGIPINALRIRVHRIKSQLQRCMEKCLRRRQS